MWLPTKKGEIYMDADAQELISLVRQAQYFQYNDVSRTDLPEVVASYMEAMAGVIEDLEEELRDRET
jgi:hypothetical protein